MRVVSVATALGVRIDGDGKEVSHIEICDTVGDAIHRVVGVIESVEATLINFWRVNLDCVLRVVSHGVNCDHHLFKDTCIVEFLLSWYSRMCIAEGYSERSIRREVDPTGDSDDTDGRGAWTDIFDIGLRIREAEDTFRAVIADNSHGGRGGTVVESVLGVVFRLK